MVEIYLNECNLFFLSQGVMKLTAHIIPRAGSPSFLPLPVAE